MKQAKILILQIDYKSNV